MHYLFLQDLSMKIEKFKIISSIALAGIGVYLSQKGFHDMIEVLKTSDLNLLGAGMAGGEMAVSAVLFNQSINLMKNSMTKESDISLEVEKLAKSRKFK